MLMHTFRLVVCFAMTGIGVGCSGSDMQQAPRVSVGGKVTLEGKPLAGARVVFMPTGSTVGNGAEAYTDATGQYQLANAGAGQYKVLISRLVLQDGSLAPPDVQAEVAVRESLPAYYSDLNITTLTANVSTAGGTFDFALRSR
jgi:hypothetical protein